MKKINAFVIAVVMASLILVAGCYDNDVVYPNSKTYVEFVDEGWTCFRDGDIDGAMVLFQIAIDMDVTRPEAYLGAAWSSIALSDYWDLAINYAYMATNHDDADWGLETTTASLMQDTTWTVFECLDPVLTDDDIFVINSYGDSLLVMDGDTLVPFIPADTTKDEIHTVNNVIIGEWLYDHYDRDRFSYRFVIENDPNVIAMFDAFNGFSQYNSNVDSIVNGATSSEVYLSTPGRNVKISGSLDYETWIMFENEMTFSYVSYVTPTGLSDIPLNALASFGILQDARSANGLGIEGAGALLGVANEGEYSFTQVPNLTSLQLKGMAASIAYRNNAYRFALDICRDSGFSLNLLPADPGFLIFLAQDIEAMLQ